MAIGLRGIMIEGGSLGEREGQRGNSKGEGRRPGQPRSQNVLSAVGLTTAFYGMVMV